MATNAPVPDATASAPTRDPQATRERRAIALATLRKILLPAGSAGAALLLWEISVRVMEIPPVLLPAPSAIWAKLSQLFLPLILKHSIPTITESLIAFAISTVVGIALAGLLSSSRLLREALYPNVVFFQLIPKIALAPLFIVWLGIGAESRLSFAVFISFFPVVIATLAGLDNVDKSLLRLCKALKASEWQVFRDVRLPFALPYVFSGMKIATTFSIIGVIVGEFITSQAGLGYLVLFASAQAETELIFAAITVLCIFGLVFYGAIALAENYLRRRFGA